MSENNMGTPAAQQPQNQPLQQQPVPNAGVPGAAPAAVLPEETPKKKTGLIVGGIVAALVVVLVIVGVVFYNVLNSKPEKAEVQAGLEQIWNKEVADNLISQLSMAGMPRNEATEKVQGVAKPYAECVTDKIYDKADSRTLKYLAEGEDKQDPADRSLVERASAACAEEAIRDALQ